MRDMKRARLNALRAEWKEQGKTQNQIARELGISQAQLSRILNRESKPSADVALLIEQKLGLTLRDLVEAR